MCTFAIQSVIAMNYQETITYLYNSAPLFQNIGQGAYKEGLSNTHALDEHFKHPHHKFRTIHVAGTNGKGSFCSMLSSILMHAGYRTGLYTSPHMVSFNERMRVNGEYIDNETLAEITSRVRPLADSMADRPTEFELVSCIAFEYFYRNKCDIVVLEVGMGGALDSTNVIDVPEVAVITNIGLDHTDFLGNTLEEIAETKAGIFKEGGSAVVYRGAPSVEQVFEEICREKNIAAGVVLSAVGCISQGRVRDASGVNIREIDDHCEIVSLNGTVSAKRCHIHIALSKEDLSTIGGHLCPGCIVNTTCELVIGELPGIGFGVEEDLQTGYDELVFEKI